MHTQANHEVGNVHIIRLQLGRWKPKPFIICQVCEEKVDPKDIYWFYKFRVCHECVEKLENMKQEELRKQVKERPVNA